MTQSHETSQGSGRRSRSGLWVLLLIVILVIGAGAFFLLRTSSSTNSWTSTYESTDTSAISQDNRAVANDLALAPSAAIKNLGYDCQIGERDTARILSHPQPADTDLRRLYRVAVLQDAKVFDSCVSMLLPGSHTTAAHVLSSIRQGFGEFDHEIVAVNARAQQLGLGSLLSPAL